MTSAGTRRGKERALTAMRRIYALNSCPVYHWGGNVGVFHRQPVTHG
jgi:hypothetical protein